MSDLRQAPEYTQWMRSIGWQVENKMFIKKLPLVPWPFIKIQRQEPPIDLAAAKNIGQYKLRSSRRGAMKPIIKSWGLNRIRRRCCRVKPFGWI